MSVVFLSFVVHKRDVKMFFACDLLHECIGTIKKRMPQSIPINREGVNPQVLGLFDLFANHLRIVAGVINFDMVRIPEPRLKPGDDLGCGFP